jgi:hypothetical protein
MDVGEMVYHALNRANFRSRLFKSDAPREWTLVNRMTSLQLGLARALRVPRLVAHYIKAQRERFSPQAIPLTAAQMAAMSGFFPSQTLDAARVLELDGARLENPPFRWMLVGMGFSGLRDLSQITAITFHDVIVSHVPFSSSLLFHELVHVEQYRQLGIPRFAELYVRGFLSRGGYDGIPLEVNAYGLGRLFEADRQRQFSVADAVARWVREDRF